MNENGSTTRKSRRKYEVGCGNGDSSFLRMGESVEEKNIRPFNERGECITRTLQWKRDTKIQELKSGSDSERGECKSHVVEGEEEHQYSRVREGERHQEEENARAM